MNITNEALEKALKTPTTWETKVTIKKEYSLRVASFCFIGMIILFLISYLFSGCVICYQCATSKEVVYRDTCQIVNPIWFKQPILHEPIQVEPYYRILPYCTDKPPILYFNDTLRNFINDR